MHHQHAISVKKERVISLGSASKFKITEIARITDDTPALHTGPLDRGNG